MKAEKVGPFLWHVCAYGYIGSEPPLSPHRSSTKKTDRHDITEILLKVALNIIFF
jgi:hypothetical protein